MIWHNIDSKIAQCKTDKDYSSTHRYSALFHLGGNHFVSLGQADDSLHMYPLGCYFPVFYYNLSGELSAAFHCTRSIDLDILTSKEVLDHDPSVCHYGVAWSKHSILEEAASFDYLPITSRPAVRGGHICNPTSRTDADHCFQSIGTFVHAVGGLLILDIAWFFDLDLK